jgi:hypothetical protein
VGECSGKAEKEAFGANSKPKRPKMPNKKKKPKKIDFKNSES